VDEDLNRWLGTHAAKFKPTDFDHLLDQLQEQMPRYAGLYGYWATAPSQAELTTQLQTAAGNIDPSLNSLGLLTRQTGPHAFLAVMMAACRVPDFSPEALSDRRTKAMLGTCPSCRSTHLWRSTQAYSVITLACPHCQNDYAIIAPDNQGSYRYINEFLTGYEPPARFAAKTTRFQEMLTIWQAVWDDCSYKRDNRSPTTTRESWQPGVETLTRQSGDCEDSSILAADWLISRGFDARVVIGKAGPQREGHAWVVVLVEGIAYLIESTMEPPPAGYSPTVMLLGKNYFPEAMFDRETIYFPRDPRIPFDGDYWSSNWRRVVPRERKLPSKAEPVITKNPPSATDGRHVSMPMNERPTPSRMTSIDRLREVSPGSIWQLDVPRATKP